MQLLSYYARGKKLNYFMKGVSKEAKILDVGCGVGWLRESLRENGWKNYVGLDTNPAAEIHGDIRDWRSLGIERDEYDVIVAFEVVEHLDCFQELYDILKPGGKLMLTSPVPHMDWLCWGLEFLGLNQKRTSPHDRLIYFNDIPLFEPIEIRTVAFIAQWGIFRKPDRPSSCNNQRQTGCQSSQ